MCDALVMGPTVRGRHDHTPHAPAGRRRRRPHAGADGHLPRGRGRARADLRAGLRLWPRAGRVDARRRQPATRPMPPAPARRSGSRRTWRSASRPAGSAPGTRSKAGERAYVALAWGEGLPTPADVDDAQRRIDETVRFWRHWLGRARPMADHRWREAIQRSALTIKGLTYMPTGATVAALTTSLPETPGGERNWDYRYTWMRDSTFTLQALHLLGLDGEAEEFMQFVADLEPNSDGGLQIMYGIDGRRDLTETLPGGSVGLCGRSPGADRQRRLRPAPERRVRRGARLDPQAHDAQPAPAPASVADRAGAGGVRNRGLETARPGDLGGPRQAAALRLLEAHVLGRDGPRRQARRDPRRPRARGQMGRDRRGDPRRHPRPRAQEGRAAPALRDRGARRLDAAGGDRSDSCPAATSACTPRCSRSPTI